MTTLVLASNNVGKLRELQALCQAHAVNVSLVTQGELGIQEAVEDGQSFIENAIIKARHASTHSNLPAIADDSGLCVPILNHAPGIHSARYAGEHGNDAANNNKLLQELLAFRDQPIKAYFVCVLAFVRHPNDPLPIITVGRWHGEISSTLQGEQGFGYDPIFWLPNLQKTAAMLDKTVKNQLSHRALAMQQLMPLLPQALSECAS